MYKIEIVVENRRADVLNYPCIVCGNSDYIIDFKFSPEWNEVNPKTARFVYKKDGDELFTEVIFEGNSCQVPILTDILEVKVGVYAGDLYTSTPAEIPCQKSITCISGEREEPPEDVYNQLLKKYDEAITTIKRLEDRLNNNFANVIRNTENGRIVTVNDVIPISHKLSVKVDNETITDLSSVNVTQIIGENLSPITRYTTADEWLGNINLFITTPGTYFFSVDLTRYQDDVITKPRISVIAYYKDGKYETVLSLGEDNPNDGIERNYNGVFTIADKPIERLRIILFNGNNPGKRNAKADKIVLGLFNKTVTANEDGTVEGLDSISPTMTLVSHSTLTNINLEYNADTKRYIDKSKN